MVELIKTIYFGSDHAGFLLKSHLVKYVTEKFTNFKIVDLGCDTNEKSVDYPNFSYAVAQSVAQSKNTALVCGSGIGISMAANKCQGAKACMCFDSKMGETARQMGINIISMGERIVGKNQALEIVDGFLSAKGGKNEEFEKYVQQFEEKYLCK